MTKRTPTNRPAFLEMMQDARKRKFNVLVVWKLDRLSRSLKDLIDTLDELGSLGIDFVSYDNNLDTSTPTGKLAFQVVGAVAEFEKDIIPRRLPTGEAGSLTGWIFTRKRPPARPPCLLPGLKPATFYLAAS